MSIIIHGMDMPTSPILFCIHPDGKVFADLEGGWREYKAIPVPPHGRLIDADELKKKFPHDYDWDYPVNSNRRVNEDIDEAPTIVEAEEKHLWCATHIKCPKCNKIWTAVYPILTRRLECPKCGCFVRAKR